jgi:putative membrane protein
MDYLLILGFTLLGTMAGCLFSLFPSLHIYNVAGIVLIIWMYVGDSMDHLAVAPFFVAMITAFSFVNTIPMTFFGAPDESATVTVLPGTKYFMQGRGYEAAVLSGVGGLLGVAIMVVMTPFAFILLPYMDKVLSAHTHWLLMLVMVYLLMSEWPKGSGYGKTRLQKFNDAWGNIWAGLFTFAASGLLGIIIISKGLISPEMGFQNIMPVFVGLFALPSIIQNLVSLRPVPPQHICKDVDLQPIDVAKSVFVGSIAGGISSYLPAVTAGIGSILAGHLTALGFSKRGDVLFIVGGSIGKTIYYVGAFLLLFVLTPLTPNGVGKGGLNIILRPIFSPESGDYLVILSVIILSGCLSFLILLPASRVILTLVPRLSYHKLYWVAAVMITGLVLGMTGLAGLFTMTVATMIGLVPVFFHSRRSNCMAVLLVPICSNMAGYGDAIAAFFGLV